jgi:N-methylhydantoinase A
MPRPQISAGEPSSAAGSAAGHRRVYVDGEWQDVAAWRREVIGGTREIAGPAIVEEDYTAIYVAPGWSLTLGRDGHLVAARSEELA